MTAVLGGLGAAVIWAAGSTLASRATRGLGPRLTLAWVMLGVVMPIVTTGHRISCPRPGPSCRPG